MKKIFLSAFFFLFLLHPLEASEASSLSFRLSGYILLQVENNGEAWYVNPSDQTRHYLGRPHDAFNIMRDLGIGITNNDLIKIPIGSKKEFSEEQNIDPGFANRQKGKIFLQVENNGEAWYVNPEDGKRYFLGRPHDAFDLMRDLGLGISNRDLALIRINSGRYTKEENVFLKEVEQKINTLINIERRKAGLSDLAWNESLALVAKEHSESLARENRELTGIGYSCDFPFIHHEGFDFGLYHSDRLANRSISYFSHSAENIALLPLVSFLALHNHNDIEKEKIINCGGKRDFLDNSFSSIMSDENDPEKISQLIQEEANRRKKALLEEKEINIIEEFWTTAEEVSEKSVEGWMNSEGHRNNILNGVYNQSGIGASSVNGYLIVTQVFIKRIGN